MKGWTLANGLVLEVYDESAQYYADFWNLNVVIRGTVKINPQYLQTICSSNAVEREAKAALGHEAIYRRKLTRIGVREAKKGETIQKLLASFEENTLPYLNHPAFPKKLVRHQWQKLVEELAGKEAGRG